MSSWLQAQLKAAENLLEAVDRTVSATTGGPAPLAGAPGAPGPDQLPVQGAAANNTQACPSQPAPASGGPQQQGFNQHGSPLAVTAPLLAANVSKGLQWLAGSPKPGGSPASGSPAHPAAAAAAAAGPKQQQPLWQPFVPQQPAPSSSVTGAPVAGQLAGGPQLPGSRASPAATPPSSTGSYTTKAHGPFSSQPVHSRSGSSGSASASGSQPPALGANRDAAAPVAPAAAPVPAPWQPAPAAALTEPTGDSHLDTAAASGAVGQAAVEPLAEPAVGALEPAVTETAPADDAPVQQEEAEAATAADAPVPVAAASSSDAPHEQQQQPEPQDEHTPAASFDHTAAEPGPPSVAAADAPPAASASSMGDMFASAASAVLSDQPGLSGAPSADMSSLDGATAASTTGAAADPAAAASSSAAAAASGGNASAKEAQLTRLVETLRKRLEVVRGENQQLEDMLHEAEQRSSAEQAAIAKLSADLTALQREQEGLVSSAAANAAAQDAHIGRLQAELEASSRQVSALQAELQAVQEQHAQALSSKDSMEGGALEALRAEVATYEGQLEAERRAHAATKAAASTRERDLEEQLGSSSEALAATQRQLEEASSRAREAEQQQLLAAAEAARLQQQVAQFGEQQSPGHQPDPHLQLQQEAEREALQRRIAEAEAQAVAALQAQRAAESRVAELQGEVAHLHSSYQAQAASRGAPQLEQQLRELQELLYQKQQQMERLSGEKQAQQLMLERQITSLKSELGKAHAAAAAVVTGVHMRGSSQHDIIPMDALGEPYQRLARHNKLGGAVKATANFLDTTAASASQLLRQQPLARLAVFLYVVLIHLYVYFLLARMQRQALSLVAGDHATGVGPELMMHQQAPPAQVTVPPMPAAATGQP